jgi:acetyltransferase-like isoleucine patch superfamily enzyme
MAPTAIIGTPFRPLLDGRRLTVDRDTVVEEDVWIGEYTTIGQGVTIGSGSILEDFVGVEPGTVIGPRVLVSSRSWIGIGARVDHDSVIKGYIGDNSQIGAGCRIFGDLIHRQLDPSIPWDDPAGEEPAPVVEDGAFIGWGALIVGGVTIRAGAYICAGALITKNVPAGYIGSGRNRIMPPGAWLGRLGKSPFLQNSRRSRPLRLGSWRPQPGQDYRWGDLGDAQPAGQWRNYLRARRQAIDVNKPQAPELAGRHRRQDG